MRTKPELAHAARPATYEVDAVNEKGERVPTSVAGEHPLTLYLDKRELVTLMTLGGAPAALSARCATSAFLLRSTRSQPYRSHLSSSSSLPTIASCPTPTPAR
jgi:hypothetical protein